MSAHDQTWLLAILGWALAGGGGGCGTLPPSLACPFGLSSDHFAWLMPDEIGPSVAIDIGHALAFDCEWDGIIEGPEDSDGNGVDGDVTDPRWSLDHGIEGWRLHASLGLYGTDDLSLVQEVWGERPVAAGATYRVYHEGSGVARSSACIEIWCGETMAYRWWSTDAASPPDWTAPADGVCQVGLFSAVGKPPAESEALRTDEAGLMGGG